LTPRDDFNDNLYRMLTDSSRTEFLNADPSNVERAVLLVTMQQRCPFYAEKSAN